MRANHLSKYYNVKAAFEFLAKPCVSDALSMYAPPSLARDDRDVTVTARAITRQMFGLSSAACRDFIRVSEWTVPLTTAWVFSPSAL